MLAIIRIFCAVIVFVSICIFGIVYCLLVPGKFMHAAIFGRLFGCMAPIFGIQLEIRQYCSSRRLPNSCVYVSNHQNNYDIVTLSYVMQPNTVTIGKKQLLWLPLFGQLYWLSGNILIDRARSGRQAYSVLMKIIKIVTTNNISVWIFPEGTRNRGRGLLPFRSGAFYIAILAKIPIVPICISNISGNKIKLNRWSNGLVIIEILPPIAVDMHQFEIHQVRRIAAYCHKVMQLKIIDLNQEVLLREK